MSPTFASPLPVETSDRLLAIAARLDSYARRYETVRDSRCVFTRAYALMTEILARELPLQTETDVEWVVELAEAFAVRYFEALDLDDRGENAGAAWNSIFTTINNRQTSVIEDLASAMTGHIVHDLPLALGDVDFFHPTPYAHVRDYHAVNDVLAEAIDPIVAEVTRRYNPWLRWLDVLGRKQIDVLTNYGIRVGRGMAWYNAVRLAHPVAAPEAEQSIETSPQAFLDLLFRPRFWSLRFLIRVLDRVIAWGRRWPQARAQPAAAPAQPMPNQAYYFTFGAGYWTGTFTFRITSWRHFFGAPLGFQNRILAFGMAAIMAVVRKARLTSLVTAYPDQNAAGVAANLVRISVLGITLYLLREEYVLDGEGRDVRVICSERFGPLPFILNRAKHHTATVSAGGTHATYLIPLLGADWIGEYTVDPTSHHLESTLRCRWAEAREVINRRRDG